MIHVYTAPHRPATRYRIEGVGMVQRRRRTPVWTACCKQRRWAVYCTVQDYYDGPRLWCRPGRGCKRLGEGKP